MMMSGMMVRGSSTNLTVGMDGVCCRFLGCVCVCMCQCVCQCVCQHASVCV